MSDAPFRGAYSVVVLETPRRVLARVTYRLESYLYRPGLNSIRRTGDAVPRALSDLRKSLADHVETTPTTPRDARPSMGCPLEPPPPWGDRRRLSRARLKAVRNSPFMDLFR